MGLGQDKGNGRGGKRKGGRGDARTEGPGIKRGGRGGGHFHLPTLKHHLINFFWKRESLQDQQNMKQGRNRCYNARVSAKVMQ